MRLLNSVLLGRSSIGRSSLFDNQETDQFKIIQSRYRIHQSRTTACKNRLSISLSSFTSMIELIASVRSNHTSSSFFHHPFHHKLSLSHHSTLSIIAATHIWIQAHTGSYTNTGQIIHHQPSKNNSSSPAFVSSDRWHFPFFLITTDNYLNLQIIQI